MKTLPEKTAEQLTPMQIAVYAVNCPNTDECINEIAGLIEKDRKEIETWRIGWNQLQETLKTQKEEIERLKDQIQNQGALFISKTKDVVQKQHRIWELEEALREWLNYGESTIQRERTIKALTKESAPSKEIAGEQEELPKVVKFLLGEGELDGAWYGDRAEGKNPYWWRTELRKLFVTRKP